MKQSGKEKTFLDYICNNPNKLKERLKTDNVKINEIEQEINYKKYQYTISEEGKIGKKDTSCIGEYIHYNVEYTDVYENEKRYAKTTGWKILKKIDYDDGRSDIEIISTGMPCKFKYDSSTIKSATWTGTESERQQYVKKYFDTEENKEAASVYAATGLINNFRKINFQEGISNTPNNQGAYVEIQKENEKQTGNKNGNELLALKNVYKIRSVMHTDIPGIDIKTKQEDEMVKFILNDKTEMFNLKSLQYTKGYYWIATTNINKPEYLCNVWYNGKMRKPLS